MLHTFFIWQTNYDEMFTKKVYSAPLMSGYDVKKGVSPNEKVVRVEYTDKASFKKLSFYYFFILILAISSSLGGWR